MPRIVMVNTVATGSHGRIMGDMGRAAEQAGFDVTVAFGRGGGNEKAIRIGNTRDVLFHVALTRLLDRHGRGSRRATQALVETLRRMKPDMLHLHNLHGYYLHIETLFAYIRESGVPTLWTLHDCWALTGHCSHFVRASCDRWQTGCYRCPLKGEYPASLFCDASRSNWHWKGAAFSGLDNLTLVAPSLWLGEVIGQSYLQDVPCRVIPNGVDLSLFRPAEGDGLAVRERMGVKPGQAMLLAVAAPFDGRKGYADALALAEKLGDRARLVLVGLSKKQRSCLPEGITGILRTDGPEALVALYGAADCLINPTYEDTYPTVNMEALACGTPVAAYATGGCIEQLVEPVGIAVPCGDVGALAEAAMSLAARRKGLTEACRTYAEAHFDRENAMNTYVAEYRQMTGGNAWCE